MIINFTTIVLTPYNLNRLILMTAFPHEIFPSLSPKTRGVGGRYYLGGQGDVQYEVLEYGKIAGMKEVPTGGVCFKSEGSVVLKEDNVSLRDICFQYKASMCVTRPTAYLLRHQIHVSFRYTTELRGAPCKMHFKLFVYLYGQ